MEVTETTVTNDGTEEIRRRKRSVGQSQDVLFKVNVIYFSFCIYCKCFFFIQMNKLSQKLMISIEKSYFNQQKNAKQVFPDLCKYAAFERNKSLNVQKIWAALQRFVNSKCSKFWLLYFIPIYSFGASWLAARLSDDYLSVIKQFGVILKACG